MPNRSRHCRVSAAECAFLTAAVGRTAAKIGASVRARADEVQLALDGLFDAMVAATLATRSP